MFVDEAGGCESEEGVMDVMFARPGRGKGGGEANIFQIVVNGDGGDWDAKGR